MTKASQRKPPLRLPNTPGSIKSLRSYWKDRFAQVAPEQFKKEIFGESNRASVILMAAYLDDALTKRLTQAMAFRIDTKHFDHIFRFEGPLGSFSSRIEIAYLFGVIDDNMRSQLTDLREVRNACAHCGHEISFAVPELRAVIRRIFRPVGITPFPQDEDLIGTYLFLEFVVMSLTLMRSRAYALDAVTAKLSELVGEHTPLPDIRPEL